MKRTLPGLMDKNMQLFFILLLLSMMMFSCAGVDPRKVDVELKETAPRAKITSYTEAITNLGLMTEIYNTDLLLIQSNPIGDKTGSSQATGGEIPRDITEMMKSSLNSIGGKVVYIPYDPAFIQNQMVTGYSNFQDKIIPNVVLSGGITEFDRGLETRGDNTDISAGAEFTGMPDWLPSKEVELKAKDSGKEGLARITLDFNLLDFRTMSGLSKMTAVNTMEVHKAMGEKEFGITLFGPTFGLRGSIKKVQGRHAAVRLLVELSTIQIVGKYLILPYWRLLGDDAEPDKVVIDTITKYYYSLSESQKISDVKSWLYLYGYDVPLNDELDGDTQQALMAIGGTDSTADSQISLDTFLNVYTNIPVTHEAHGRQQMLARLMQQQKAAEAESVKQAQAAPEVARDEYYDDTDPEDAIPRRRGVGEVMTKDELIDVINELSK